MITQQGPPNGQCWENKILEWCEEANERIRRGRFRVRPDCRSLVRVAKSAPRSERLESLRLAHDALESTATTIYESRQYGRKMQPKLAKYYAFTTIPRQNWVRKEYLQWIIQWLYTLLAGRMLTPLGPLRFYAIVAIVGTFLFVPFYAVKGGIEWSSQSTSSRVIDWYHYIYFSGLTLTTLGYGDLHPTDAPRCIIAIVQAILGYLVLGLGVYVVTQYLTLYAPDPRVPNLATFVENYRQYRSEWCGDKSSRLYGAAQRTRPAISVGITAGAARRAGPLEPPR